MTTTSDTYAAAVLDEALLDPDGTDPGAFGRAMEPFGRSRMMPPTAYTSPEVLAWERRNLFAGTWTCVGREVDLREGDDGPRTRRAVGVGDVSVMLTWDSGRDGSEPAVLRAFANTCRHRGARAGARRRLAGSGGGQAFDHLPLPRVELRPGRPAAGGAGLPRRRGVRPLGAHAGRAAGRALARLGVRARAAHPRAGRRWCRSTCTSASSSRSWRSTRRRTSSSVSGTRTRSRRTGRWSPRTTTSATTAR